MRHYYWSILILSLSRVALAGSWVSGGGNLLFDDINPWFVQNSSEVRYCVKIDEKNFGVDARTALEKVQSALAFWQNELGRADYAVLPSRSGGAGYQIRLGQHRFVEVSCDRSPDISFQFGVIASQEQRDYLRDPQRIVGMSVRTDYDQRNLRGKGFIYIAPEQGELAMQHPLMVSQVWSRDSSIRLKLILIHELGHVFGLQHTNQGAGLMDEDFADTLVTRQQMPSMNIRPSVFRHHERFFAMRGGFSRPGWMASNAVLGLPEGWDLVQMSFKTINDKPEIHFWGGIGGEVSSLRTLGHAKFEERMIQYLPYVSIYLTEEQRVFEADVRLHSRLTVAQARTDTYTGTYEVDGSIRQIFMTIDADRLNIGGSDAQGKLFPLVFYAQSWWDYVEVGAQ
jgi:hypothetical protein